jgi:pyruvate-ferredoxin/flavodoxin oxidoreductase
MVPIASQLDTQRINLDYAVNHVTIKDNILPRHTINGSQLQQPLLEFSGACGGCGETPYIKLLTQLFGERMLIANATGCSSIWGANMPGTAYCVNKDGHGPAWANSLFEDNAEYGYGIALAMQHRRDLLADKLRTLIEAGTLDKPTADAVNAWLANPGSVDAAAALQPLLPASLSEFADMVMPKSVWAIGGDGWAYDIGFAGLDHVIASGQNINIFVMDTECYSNTGGQTSKATPLGAVTKYSPDGKRTGKKDLGRMAMTYGSVYVASICLGANYQQAINAMVEAEAFDGPSLIIAYCPCINHGIRAGMGHDILEEREAVKSGYWPLYRFNPDLAKQGKQPLTVDYQAPDGQLIPFINGEDRYADLKMIDPNEAAILQPALKTQCDDLYKTLTS